MARDYAYVELSGATVTAWDSYDIDSDLMTPADAFSLVFPLPGNPDDRKRVLDVVRATPTLKIYIARDVPGDSSRTLQMTGIIDQISVQDDRKGGPMLRIKGRDKAGLLVSASANPRLGVTTETEFVSFVRQMVQPYDIEIITEGVVARNLCTGRARSAPRSRTQRQQARAFGVATTSVNRGMARRTALQDGRPLDGNASTGRAASTARRGHANAMTGSDVERLRLPEAKPQVGETVWDFIDRHAKRFGVMAWMDPQGRLVLSSPDYNQEPICVLQRYLDPGLRNARNNIIQGGFVEDLGSQPSSVTVYGRSGGRDASRSRFHATVSQEVHVTRPLVVHDPSVRSQSEAVRRAKRELHRLAQDKFVLEYQVADHSGSQGYLYAVDTIVDVHDEAIGVRGRYYCTSRKFTKSRTEGTQTHLRLVPIGAIAL